MQRPGQSIERPPHEFLCRARAVKLCQLAFGDSTARQAHLPHRGQIVGIWHWQPQGQLSQAAHDSCGDAADAIPGNVIVQSRKSCPTRAKIFRNSDRNREMILWLDVRAGKEKDCLRRAASLYRAKDLHAARKLPYKAKFTAQVSPLALRQGAVS